MKRLSQPSAAAEVIGANLDLLIMIFLHLPALSLIRFKRVSKFWLTLISDPYFSAKHTRMNPNSPISGFYLYKIREQLIPLSFGYNRSIPSLTFLKCIGGVRSRFVAISSSNGLLLCRFSNKFETSGFVVCNSSTRKYNVLPNPTISQGLRHAVLAFDPKYSPLYRVVLVSVSNVLQLDIFSSNTASWKLVEASAPHGDYFSSAFYWDGSVHWMSSNQRRSFYWRFDLQSEKLKMVEMPPTPRIGAAYGKIRYFGECGGRLLLLYTTHASNLRFDIFEMGHDCNRLIKQFSVYLKSQIPETFYGSDGDFSVLHVKKEAKGEGLELLIAIGNKVVSYNTGSRALNPLSHLMSLSHGYQIRDCFSDIFGINLSRALPQFDQVGPCILFSIVSVEY